MSKQFELPRPLLSWFLGLIFVMLLTFTCLIVLISGKNPIAGWQLLIVSSGSMEPTIPTGSVVLIHQQQSYALNDIVTFRDGNRLLTHRIVEETPLGFQTQGDANQSRDISAISQDDITGKVFIFVPLLGYFLAFLQSPLGVTLFVVIPGTILMYEHLKKVMSIWNRQNAVLVAILVWGLAVPIRSTLAEYVGSTNVDNVVFATTRWILPQANFARDDSDLLVSISDAGSVDKVVLEVKYSHVVEGETIQEALTSTVDKAVTLETMSLPPLTIGTCSDDVCVPHEDVENMEISVRFLSDDETVHEIVDTFEF